MVILQEQKLFRKRRTQGYFLATLDLTTLCRKALFLDGSNL